MYVFGAIRGVLVLSFSFSFPSSVFFLPYRVLLFALNCSCLILGGFLSILGWLGFLFLSKWGGVFLSPVFIPTFVKPLCCFWVISFVFVWSSLFFFPFKSSSFGFDSLRLIPLFILVIISRWISTKLVFFFLFPRC